MGKLPDVPTVDEVMTMPPIPATTDPKSLEAWREEVVRLSHERGGGEGREAGLREGEAKLILAILRGRGIAVSDEEASRILACQDEAQLARLLERALSVKSAAALWG